MGRRRGKFVVTIDDLDRVRSQNLPKEVEVRDRDEMIAVQWELAAVAGTTVLIHDQERATEKRRKRKRGQIETPTSKVVINERICEGCGDCDEKSNCLSVHPIDIEFGRKTAIHQSSCNLDYSCLKGDCPAFVTVTPGHAGVKVHTPPLVGSRLPEPENVSSSDGFAMRILGVGGTGVVTASSLSRVCDLIEYQNDSYAKEYTDFVEQVRVAESAAARTTIVTEAVARYLYKLMGYKDEYGVARLAVDPAFRSKLSAEFGEDATVKIRLHPPSLRAMGLKDKLALRSWINPWLRLLYGMRWVRGTRLDILGYSKMRRLERTLVDEYRATILEVAQWLSPQTVELAAEIAGLPDLVRGYEDVKLRAVEIYRTRTAERLEQLREGGG